MAEMKIEEDRRWKCRVSKQTSLMLRAKVETWTLEDPLKRRKGACRTCAKPFLSDCKSIISRKARLLPSFLVMLVITSSRGAIDVSRSLTFAFQIIKAGLLRAY
jgi:hypothetical protein